MKKFILLASAAAAVSFTACNGGAGSASSNGLDSLFSQEKADSLVIAMAEVNGMQDFQKFEQALFQDSTLSKEKFIKGVKYVMSADTSLSFLYGMYDGMNFVGQLKQLESMGIKVDRAAYINNFQKSFMADSLNELQAGEARQTANRLQNELREAYMAYERAKVENSPEAIENVKRSRAYIDSLTQADKDVKLLASGVAYKIEQPGEGENLTEHTRAMVRYSARTLDGRQFDKSPEELRPASVGARVQGLREAMTHLSKGAKATIYVPGKEAFGVEQNRFGVGPNEMVVYDVEIVDVVTDENK